MSLRRMSCESDANQKQSKLFYSFCTPIFFSLEHPTLKKYQSFDSAYCGNQKKKNEHNFHSNGLNMFFVSSLIILVEKYKTITYNLHQESSFNTLFTWHGVQFLGNVQKYNQLLHRSFLLLLLLPLLSL